MAKGQHSRETRPSTTQTAKVKTSVSIPEDVLQALKHEAVEQHTDVSGLIVTIATEYLKRRKGGR